MLWYTYSAHSKEGGGGGGGIKLIGTKFFESKKKLTLVNAAIQDGHITFKQPIFKSDSLRNMNSEILFCITPHT